MTIAITGATGHIGSVAARLLLDQEQRVRVVGRDAARLKPFTDRGAEAAVGDVEDAASAARALAGAQAAFLMIPPNYGAPDVVAHATRVAKAYAQALRSSPVTHVVALSSIGADAPYGSGIVDGLRRFEEALADAKQHVLILRPGWFFENSFNSIGLIQQSGINGSPLKPDLAIPAIATKDIGAVVAKRLAARDFTGRSVQELQGPADLSQAQATRELGRAIGKPDLAYVPFGYDDTEKALAGMGLSADAARQLVRMYRSFNDGVIKPTQRRDARTTTPTTFAGFATEVFAPAYRAQSGGAARG